MQMRIHKGNKLGLRYKFVANMHIHPRKKNRE